MCVGGAGKNKLQLDYPYCLHDVQKIYPHFSPPLVIVFVMFCQRLIAAHGRTSNAEICILPCPRCTPDLPCTRSSCQHCLYTVPARGYIHSNSSGVGKSIWYTAISLAVTIDSTDLPIEGRNTECRLGNVIAPGPRETVSENKQSRIIRSGDPGSEKMHQAEVPTYFQIHPESQIDSTSNAFTRSSVILY
jgi:hypothetical protein